MTRVLLTTIALSLTLMEGNHCAHAQQGVCLAEKAEIESENIASNGQNRVLCNNCSSNNNPPGFNLFCNDACVFCQDDIFGGVCGRIGEGAIFSGTSEDTTTVTQVTETFRFNGVERNELIFLIKGACVPKSGTDGDDADDVTCSTCRVIVAGTECNSCSMVSCGTSDEKAPSFDCINVETDAQYNLCPATRSAIARNSLFEYWKEEDGNYDTCFLGGTAQVPTASPVDSPPPTISVGCTVQVATQNCAPLLENTLNNSPIEGCDCYNFCGSEYVGCCERDSTCQVECVGTTDIVAGCQFKNNLTQVPEPPACSVTLSNGTIASFMEAESFGSLIFANLCGSAEEFPCFCNSVSEADGALCPYCTFTDINGDVICAKDGESATYVNEDGVEVICNCDYISNNIAAIQCQSTDVDMDSCLLSSGDLGRCPDLLRDIGGDLSNQENCDCFNYCGTAFAGCCKKGETCSVDCTSVATIDITAGCAVPDGETFPPSLAPVVAPTQAPQVCPLQTANLDGCGALINGISAMIADDCECLNFCGTEFVGCCPKGGACSVNCVGIGGPRTSGCPRDATMPPTPSLPPGVDPTPAPVVVPPCPIRVGQLASCPSFLNSIPGVLDDPDIDCDCYNFCGSSYTGCCKADGACSVSCNTGGGITAGCRLDDLDQMSPTMMPATMTPIAMPTNMPVATTQPVTPTMAPVATTTTPVATTTQPVTLTMAPVASTPAPVATAQPVTTTAAPVATVQPVATTLAPVAPTQPQCSIRFGNTAACPALTEDIGAAVPADCGCYNYCGTTYRGCCKLGQSRCSVSCAGVGGPITAGCTLEGGVTTTTMPVTTPSMPPVNMPTAVATGMPTPSPIQTIPINIQMELNPFVVLNGTSVPTWESITQVYLSELLNNTNLTGVVIVNITIIFNGQTLNTIQTVTESDQPMARMSGGTTAEEGILEFTTLVAYEASDDETAAISKVMLDAFGSPEALEAYIEKLQSSSDGNIAVVEKVDVLGIEILPPLISTASPVSAPGPNEMPVATIDDGDGSDASDTNGASAAYLSSPSRSVMIAVTAMIALLLTSL